MINEDSVIQKYINEKRKLQKIILHIIENSDIEEEKDFQCLIDHLNKYEYEGNKDEIEHFLHLISVISINHNRQPNFYEKIEKILMISFEFYRKILSNKEIFEIFKESKPILLYLIKTKIITIDEIIFTNLLNYKEKTEKGILHYFYPEMQQAIKSGIIHKNNDQIYNIIINENFENFEKNRKQYENEHKICSIIRDDLIDDFIILFHQNNFPLSSKIKNSIFETNPIFISKEPTLIEYAMYFGSIRIIKYLYIKNVEFKSSLWLYAVHSNNPEVIEFLEEKKITIDDRTFSEAIKCHHIDIAYYIYNNYFDCSKDIMQLDESNISTIYSSNNFEFFSNEIDENIIFFILCKYNYTELVNLHLKFKIDTINRYIIWRNKSGIKNVILKALKENKLDVAYYLLMKFEFIPELYFKDNNEIKKIALPPNIRLICNESFFGCTNLTQIYIPSSVTSIGILAFGFCSNLTQIYIPSSVTSIGECAFGCCLNLTQISIPSSVTTIGEGIFANCNELKNITIRHNSEERIKYFNDKLLIFKSTSMNEIFDNILWVKETIDEIIIPPFIDRIGKCAFGNYLYLTQISIPSSVTSIGEYAFCGCSLLKDILIPQSVTSIGSHAFDGCWSLIQITIPSSVTSIGSHTFMACLSLEQISISSSLISIGDHAFSRCFSLQQISISSSLTSISDHAFSRCFSLPQISIPSSITEIGDFAFAGCSLLTQISIPSFVTKIGIFAFFGCSLLTQIIIPSSVTSIGSCAFYGCSSLTQISIPSSVTEIGDYAFSGCSSLTQISIPSSVTKIGDYAFSECSSLAQISIPSSVAKIGNGVFSKCLSLKKKSISSSATLNGRYLFLICILIIITIVLLFLLLFIQ